MDKTTFLHLLITERAGWEAALARIPETRLTQPGVVGAWSVKDLIAHVTWYEREMVDLLRQRALAGSELWGLPAEQRNAAIFEAQRDRSLDEVRAEARPVFAQLVELLQTLPDQALNDPAAFQGMPADWVPWEIIAENSCTHYQQHRPDVQAWLDVVS